MNETSHVEPSSDNSIATAIRWFLVLLLIGVIGWAGYVAMNSLEKSASGKLKSGRQVTIHSTSMWLNASFANNTAVIETGGKVFKVQQDGVYLEDEQVLELDPKSMNVELRYSGGKVTLESGAPAKDDSSL